MSEIIYSKIALAHGGYVLLEVRLPNPPKAVDRRGVDVGGIWNGGAPATAVFNALADHLDFQRRTVEAHLSDLKFDSGKKENND